MTKSKGLTALGLAAAVCFTAAPVWSAAGDGDQDKHAGHDHAKQKTEGLRHAADSAKEGEHNEAAAMKAWMEFATPGEAHEAMKAWVGEWNLETTWWMAPGAPPNTSKSYSKAELIMGGRYIVEHVDGEIDMGGGNMVPFKGVSVVGYDNHKKEYFSHWIDNFGTAVMIEKGNMNEDGQLVTKGEMFDPMRGVMIKTKSISTLVDDDTRKLEMWMKPPGEDAFKSMEITYTRQ